MTLKFSESPAVQVKEIDLTGVVPAVTSTTGAVVGDFNWGPVNTPVLVGNESELASVFGTPLSGDAAAGHFLSAALFLKYSSSAYVVRADKSNSVKSTDGIFSAKYPGKLGDSITVDVCDAATWSDTTTATVQVDSDVQATDEEGNLLFLPLLDENGDILYLPLLDENGDEQVDGNGDVILSTTPQDSTNPRYVQIEQDAQTDPWAYQSLFDSAPEGDELHVVVLQNVGTKEQLVLETYPYVSKTKGDQLDNGTTNYVANVINKISTWVTVDPTDPVSWPNTYSLSGGQNGDTPSYDYTVFDNTSTIQVDFIIAPYGSSSAEHVHVCDVAEARKDCVAVVSVPYQDVVAKTFATYNSTLAKNSSYLIVDGNHIKVYNKYEDKYQWIPAASSTAGVMAATDAVSAPWFSPAGSRRGQYLGVTELLINPSKGERDAMYKLGINPIVSFSGQGVMLYGDKTHLFRPSAFDRINVRRLFLVIERAISQAGENVMFEFNDEFTRAEFVNIVEPFLREIQGRRGITDFRLVCDDTNNTPEVVDRNEFIASCFIKPARSINYVTLNFVAVRSGVEFEEVVGTV